MVRRKRRSMKTRALLTWDLDWASLTSTLHRWFWFFVLLSQGIPEWVEVWINPQGVDIGFLQMEDYITLGKAVVIPSPFNDGFSTVCYFVVLSKCSFGIDSKTWKNPRHFLLIRLKMLQLVHRTVWYLPRWTSDAINGYQEDWWFYFPGVCLPGVVPPNR